MTSAAIDDATLTNAGERMIVGNLWGYWAHLSIYHFAVPFARGRRVLDAGCGAGYGSAHLARHGAKVLALDASPVAIEHSRRRYAGDAVTFEVADLSAPLPLGDGVFDLVFSSNVFEHVGNVDGLAAECARVVSSAGTVIIAVPPIASAAVMQSDIGNQFHVHHIPPTAWHAKLQRFFTEVRCHGHVGAGAFADKDRERAEIHAPAERVTIRETDFDFPETTPERMQALNDSITAVYVCRGRRNPPGEETLAERTPAGWREAECVARAIAAAQDAAAGVGAADGRAALARQQAEAAAARAADAEARAADAVRKLAAAEAAARQAEAHAAAAAARSEQLAFRIAALEASTTWRAAAPLRAVAAAVRKR